MGRQTVDPVSHTIGLHPVAATLSRIPALATRTADGRRLSCTERVAVYLLVGMRIELINYFRGIR